jgi:hypothetical protein
MLDSDEPGTYLEAVVDTDSESWLDAIRSELKSMNDNQVWNLINRQEANELSSTN